MDIRQIPVRKNKRRSRKGKKKKKKQCVRRIHVISNILQDEMFKQSNACERASRQKKKRKKRRVHRQVLTTGLGRQQKICPNGRQFPPVVRPRFRGLRFAAVEDCSAFVVVGDAVSPPPPAPLRFNVAFAMEGVDDPAEAAAVGLGAFVCCGVPFVLSGEDAGDDVDGAFCGIVAGVIWADDGAVDDIVGVYSECVDGPALIPSGMNGAWGCIGISRIRCTNCFSVSSGYS